MKMAARVIWGSLSLLRVLWCLLPQTGYIHPDEFFQSPEVMAGNPPCTANKAGAAVIFGGEGHARGMNEQAESKPLWDENWKWGMGIFLSFWKT